MKIIMSKAILLLVLLSIYGNAKDATKENKGFSFFDYHNKKITFDKYPENIAILEFCTAPLFYGVSRDVSKISYTTKFTIDALKSKPFYQELFPELLALEKSNRAGPENIEEVMKIRPDAVLIHGTHHLVKPLMTLGITTIALTIDTRYSASSLTYSGYLTGNHHRAQEQINLQKKSEAYLKKALAGLKEKDYVNILEIRNLKAPIRVINHHHHAPYSLSGTRNLLKRQKRKCSGEIDTEQLVKLNPEIILLSTSSKLEPKDVYADALLKDTVDAVKNKRVYKVPAFNRFAETVETDFHFEWLAKIAHPDKIKVNIRERLKDKFKVVYGKEVNDKQIDQLLEIEINKDSHNYKKLFSL